MDWNPIHVAQKAADIVDDAVHDLAKNAIDTGKALANDAVQLPKDMVQSQAQVVSDLARDISAPPDWMRPQVLPMLTKT
jgi:hypothetical protein